MFRDMRGLRPNKSCKDAMLFRSVGPEIMCFIQQAGETY